MRIWLDYAFPTWEYGRPSLSLFLLQFLKNTNDDEKLFMEPRQACQKSETRRTYSTSFRMAVLSFHRPGLEGMMSGTVTETWTPQWSEKGQGTTEQAETEESHREGMPTLFHLVHVNPGVDGCRYLKMSTTQHASKRPRRAEVLSWDESDGSEPRLSKALLKTVLKSPHNREGTERSIFVWRSFRKWSWAGLRFGIYIIRR